MKKEIFRRILGLLLLLAILVCSSASLVSCKDNTDDLPGEPEDQEPTPDTGEEESFLDKVIKPAFKEYDRDTVNFSEIEYSRPKIEALGASFDEIARLIRDGSTSSEEIVNRLTALEPQYESVLSMQTISMIFAYKDSSSEFWNGEYEYICTGYPELYQKIENVMVAAAQSADALYYEEKYFGKGLIADYADGGDYTDAVVSLLEEEASLVSRYSSLSTATIEITYQQEKGTYDSFMEKIKKLYHEDSADFKSKSAHLWSLYKSTYSSIAIPIFTDLVKVRIKLADLLGYESYLHYSYEGLGRDYTPEDMSELLEGIVEYAVPVMTSPDLQYYAMIGIGGNKPLSFDQLLNNSYYILDKMDAELFEIYQYMLQFSLFDLDKPGANRYSGAFTTYIGDYEAPFLFMTGDGYLTDYMTLFHEFGHFSDYYLNGASGSSLDLMEVYSQGLEFLMTTRCDEVISEEYGTYLSNRALYNALGILIDQGFYSRFEECVYSLELEEITSERLEALLNQCAKEFGYITDTEFDGGSYMPLSTVMMVNHLFVSPGYVPSYCTSIISSLDLYYLEEETEGAGIETYKHLLALGGKGYDITEAVSQVGLSFPFEKAHLKELTNKIYYNFSGAYYWQPEDSTNNVA